jgi:hypothetical protein
MTTEPHSTLLGVSFAGAAFFIAIMATIVSVGMGLAHAFELPGKIAMSRENYFTVQTIYAGWNRVAFVLLVQLISIIALIALFRDRPAVLWPVIVSLVALIVAQVLFWTFTFPANQATHNWTTIPDNWEALRRNWEYSHLAGAIFQVICVAALVIAALACST